MQEIDSVLEILANASLVVLHVHDQSVELGVRDQRKHVLHERIVPKLHRRNIDSFDPLLGQSDPEMPRTRLKNKFAETGFLDRERTRGLSRNPEATFAV